MLCQANKRGRCRWFVRRFFILPPQIRPAFAFPRVPCLLLPADLTRVSSSQRCKWLGGDPSTLTIALPVYLRVVYLCCSVFVYLQICVPVYLCFALSPFPSHDCSAAYLPTWSGGRGVGALARLMAAHYHNNWPGHSSHNNWGPGCW